MWLQPQALRAAFFMRQAPRELTQRQRVLSLYKKVLVLARDHSGHMREYWYTEVGRARAAFEAHRAEQDPRVIEGHIQAAERWLKENAHWAPYKLPYAEDGSKFQRNTPVPEDLTNEDRLIDLEEEIRREFDTVNSDPLRPGANWRVDL